MIKLKIASLWLYRWVMRHKVLTLVLVVVGALSITPIIIITRTWFIVHTDLRPNDLAGAYTLEKQTEGFTCGVHALSTVYQAYGLDPEAERIRWRLGVDTKAVFYLSDSTGALHPDLWMVLAQDYFEVKALDLQSSFAWDNLHAHLTTGHPAILLIKRRENGNLHWVVATRSLGNEIEIYDSLFADPYAETPEFLTNHIITAVLVRPAGEAKQAMSLIDAHLAGMSELDQARKRIKALESIE